MNERIGVREIRLDEIDILEAAGRAGRCITGQFVGARLARQRRAVVFGNSMAFVTRFSV